MLANRAIISISLKDGKKEMAGTPKNNHHHQNCCGIAGSIAVHSFWSFVQQLWHAQQQQHDIYRAIAAFIMVDHDLR